MDRAFAATLSYVLRASRGLVTGAEDDEKRRRGRARNMALLLGLVAVAIYLAYILFWVVRGPAS